MATALRRKRETSFDIHEDGPATEDTEMDEEQAVQQSEAYTEEQEDQGQEQEQEQEQERERERALGHEGERRPQQEEEGQEPAAEDSESGNDNDIIDRGVQLDMEKLQHTFPGFRNKYRLIKRIGEGTFSTVYKAEDLMYDDYVNAWDLDKESEKWTPPPSKRFVNRLIQPSGSSHPPARRRPKYVAIKKIYVTSSPTRILNELELLHDLRFSKYVCPLITAFRHADQVVAILPYFRHQDFRDYFRDMTIDDMILYMRSLFEALKAVHSEGILHRDIKPTNFLYDPDSRRGVLVDFGLAEREGTDSKACLCHEDPATRKTRLRAAYATAGPHNGYPKVDTRPSRRANRAGTRGFRAPEVLFKCTEQTTKIDIWSAGVILLTILSRRFPFFNSADDIDAMIEIATIFGVKRMRAAGQLHGCIFETTIPTVGTNGFGLDSIMLWSTCRMDRGPHLTPDEELAIGFAGRCLDLDPSRRLSAEDALQHPFLKEPTPYRPDRAEDDVMQV